MAQRLLHRLFLAISFDNPNGTATVTQTSFGNFFWQSQWHSDCYTDFFWQFLLTIPMAQRLLHRLLLAISFDNPNGTATVTQTSFGNLFWQSQWHSNCYTDFFWQFLLTIPMAQRLLHRLLLAISFDNPNGTATVTQTSFGNLFWQSQWHSDCYTDFFWQFLLTIPMAQRLLHRLLLAISFDNPNGTATVTQTSFDNLFRQSQWHSDCYTDFFWQSQQSTSQWNASDPERTQKCKTKSVLHTTAIPWAHKLVTKAQRMQTKAQKQQKYCAQQQNMMHELPPDKKKSSKHCGHTS